MAIMAEFELEKARWSAQKIEYVREAGRKGWTIVECVVFAAFRQFELYYRQYSSKQDVSRYVHATYLSLKSFDLSPSCDDFQLLFGEVDGRHVCFRVDLCLLEKSQEKGKGELSI